MVPVTSLLTAIERKDVTALNDLIEHDGMAEAHFTHKEAVALWEAGWQEWLAGDKAGNAHSVHALWNRRHTTKFNGVSYPVQKAAASIYSEAGNAHWHAEEEGSEFHQVSWEAENECWDPKARLHPPLWHITLGVFLRLLHARCPELPGAPVWAEIWDVEEA